MSEKNCTTHYACDCLQAKLDGLTLECEDLRERLSIAVEALRLYKAGCEFTKPARVALSQICGQ